MIKKKNYLLVRPRGGLNDCLNQIFKCYAYAKRNNRVMLIDTEGAEGIRLDFAEVFKFKLADPDIITSVKKFPKDINTMSIFPPQISGRIESYQTTLANDKHTYVCSLTGAPITFDFGKSYTEELIVHEQWGGGLWGIELFSQIQASSWLRGEMIKALEKIQIHTPYIGVHLRFSDYRCDYKEFLRALSRQARGRNVLICSDSKKVRLESKKALRKSNVFFISEEIDTKGEPIHIFTGGEGYESKKHAILCSLLDILGLSQSDYLVFPKLTNGGAVSYSGFSLLAKGVKEKKLMKSFLSL